MGPVDELKRPREFWDGGLNAPPNPVIPVLSAGLADGRGGGAMDRADSIFARGDRGAQQGIASSAPGSRPLTGAPGDEPVLDEAVLSDLQVIGGDAMVERLLDRFETDCRGRFADLDRSQIARDAHALVSSAGMLGLRRLSQACARLEAACSGERDVLPLVGEVRILADEALAAAHAWRNGQS
jgi:HPt (histidine-containing phosphotransfer) domain-containing protein